MKMKCPSCGVSGSVADSLLGKKVRCPKCKETFRVGPEPASSAGQRESSSAAASHSKAEIPPGVGLAPQDDMALEQEIAKIFEEMKNSAMGQDADSGAAIGSREHFGAPTERDTAGGRSADKGEAPIMSEDELAVELEKMLGNRCSVCGTVIGQSNRHEIDGKVYCSLCLPGEEKTAPSEQKELAITERQGTATAEASGFWKTLAMKFTGIAIIVLVLAALVYQLYLKHK